MNYESDGQILAIFQKSWRAHTQIPMETQEKNLNHGKQEFWKQE